MPDNKEEKSFDALIVFGDTVKILENGKVGGYLVRFSNEDNPDLEGDYFTAKTDFGEMRETNVLYQHGFDAIFGKKSIGRGTLKIDEVGVWFEAQLEMRDEYEKMLLELVEAGALGLSSGTASHLVERQRTRKAWFIKSWPLGLDASLTPTPAEPNTMVQTMKSYMKSLAPKKQVAETINYDETTEEKEMAKKKDVEKVEEIEEVVEVIEVVETVKEPVEVVEEVEPVKMVAPEIDYEKLATAMNALDPIVPAKSAPAYVRSESLGDPNPINALCAWMRGANNVKGLHNLGGKLISPEQIEFKAPYQEGTASEGGNIVPNDFLAEIIRKRDEISIPRAAGARLIRTSRDVIDIPYEDASMTDFVLTNEEASYNENESTFGNASVTLYKYTKVIKISEELVDDEAANLDSFLSDAFGRAWGITENGITLVGTGSSQPQGVFVGGSVGYTFADTDSITAVEIAPLYWSLGEPYHEGAVWITRGAHLGELQALTGNNFQLVGTPPGGDLLQSSLWGKPVFLSDKVAAMTTGQKPLLFGNFNFYALVENGTLTLQRNPYLYQANGQIGVFAKVRVGGIVLQSEAFKWGILA